MVGDTGCKSGVWSRVTGFLRAQVPIEIPLRHVKVVRARRLAVDPTSL